MSFGTIGPPPLRGPPALLTARIRARVDRRPSERDPTVAACRRTAAGLWCTEIHRSFVQHMCEQLSRQACENRCPEHASERETVSYVLVRLTS